MQINIRHPNLTQPTVCTFPGALSVDISIRWYPKYNVEDEETPSMGPQHPYIPKNQYSTD